MSDTQTALAQVRKALAARPTPGEWHVWQYRRFSNPNVRNADGIYVMDAAPRRSVRKGVDASYIAACNPVNMTAILAHVDAQAAEIERLTFDNEQLRDMLARLYAGSALYSDDGELQDARAEPFIDFKRDSVADIRCAMVERGEQR